MKRYDLIELTNTVSIRDIEIADRLSVRYCLDDNTIILVFGNDGSIGTTNYELMHLNQLQRAELLENLIWKFNK